MTSTTIVVAIKTNTILYLRKAPDCTIYSAYQNSYNKTSYNTNTAISTYFTW